MVSILPDSTCIGHLYNVAESVTFAINLSDSFVVELFDASM